MENYVYISVIVIAAALIIYTVVSRQVPSKQKVVYGFVLFTVVLGFYDAGQKNNIARQAEEQKDRHSMVMADNDHKPALSVSTGM